MGALSTLGWLGASLGLLLPAMGPSEPVALRRWQYAAPPAALVGHPSLPQGAFAQKGMERNLCTWVALLSVFQYQAFHLGFHYL